MEEPLEEEDSTFTNISLADDSACRAAARLRELLPEDLNPGVESSPSTMMNADMDAVEAENQVELEEKTRLINQVLELQHTLEDLSARVDAVKEENLKLKSENQVLGQYIENLMSASSVFQTTDTKSKRNLPVAMENLAFPSDSVLEQIWKLWEWGSHTQEEAIKTYHLFSGSQS
ncbi:unnamed protein product [Caretta caretta]